MTWLARQLRPIRAGPLVPIQNLHASYGWRDLTPGAVSPKRPPLRRPKVNIPGSHLGVLLMHRADAHRPVPDGLSASPRWGRFVWAMRKARRGGHWLPAEVGLGSLKQNLMGIGGLRTHNSFTRINPISKR